MSLPNPPVKEMEKLGFTRVLISWLNRLAGAISAMQSITLVFKTGLRVLVTDASGNIAESDITTEELEYLNGVTSNIQTQLNAKAPKTAIASLTDGSGGAATNIIGAITDAATRDAIASLTAKVNALIAAAHT